MTMKLPLRCTAALVAACSLWVTPAVHAQKAGDAAPVLQGSQVTEDALVDAWAIEGPQVPPGATRGFRPAAPGQKPKPYGPGQASLLVTFVTGAADLTDESRSVLDKLAKAMQSDTLAGLSFRVEGHADARGDALRNTALSLARAEAVSAYLSSAHGVLPNGSSPSARDRRNR